MVVSFTVISNIAVTTRVSISKKGADLFIKGIFKLKQSVSWFDIKFYCYYTLVIDIVINVSTCYIGNCIMYISFEYALVIRAKLKLLINLVVAKIWS